MGDISVLCPPPEGKEEQRLYAAMRDVVRKVVVNAAIHRPRSDVLVEVYLAGLYHAAKLAGPQKRKPDYLDLTPPPRRRGRPRKANP